MSTIRKTLQIYDEASQTWFDKFDFVAVDGRPAFVEVRAPSANRTSCDGGCVTMAPFCPTSRSAVRR